MTTNRDIALEFVRCFCAGDVDGVASLLAESLQFRGPLYQFDSGSAFVQALRNSPPTPTDYEILNVMDSGARVSVYYDYHKPTGKLTIAQLFTVEGGKITDTLVVFDGRAFDRGDPQSP